MPDKFETELLSRLKALWDEPAPRMKMGLPRVEVVDLEGPEGKLPTIIPHPPQFQPAPQVVGHELGKSMNEALKIAPSLQGRVGKVQHGVTPDVMDELDLSNSIVNKTHKGTIFNPVDDFAKTSLLGLTNMHTGNISLSPRVGMDTDRYPSYWPPQLNKVLGHELTHAAGYPDEDNPEDGGNLFELLLKRKK